MSNVPDDEMAASANPPAKATAPKATTGVAPVAIGGSAGEGLRKSPDEIVKRNRHGNDRQRETAIQSERTDKQSECLASSHGCAQDHRTGDDHDRRLRARVRDRSTICC
jgi:hypothetical protein